jgi:hypothetical protein
MSTDQGNYPEVTQLILEWYMIASTTILPTTHKANTLIMMNRSNFLLFKTPKNINIQGPISIVVLLTDILKSLIPITSLTIPRMTL